MPSLERLTKTATTVSVLLILAVQIAFHPDLTWGLRAAAIVAFLASWFAAPRAAGTVMAIWVLAAPLSPVLVRAITLREGTVADLVWLAGLAGVLIRTRPWSRWSLPPGWSALVGVWACLLALAWPVLLFREAGIELARMRGLWTTAIAAPEIAPQVIRWTSYVILTQLVGVLWLDWIVGRLPERADLPRAADALWIGITISSIVAIFQGTIGMAFVNAELWTFLGRATGTMLDANAYGMCAAVAGPFAFARLRARGDSMRLLAPFVLIINLAGMWMSSSRTALLCGLIAIAGLALAESWRRDAPSRRHVLITIGASIALVMLLAITATAVGPIRRLIEVNNPASLWRRGGYGTVAIRMIREYPLAGVGIGVYRDLAPDYWSDISETLLPPDNAQNWWRHEAAELGIIGSIPIFVLSAAILWLLIVPAARPGQLASAIVARCLLAGLGASSLVGVPTLNPVVLLWFLLLTAWLMSTTESDGVWMIARHVRAVWIAGLILAVAYAAVHLMLARGSLSPLARAIRWHHEYVAGAYPPEPAESGGEFRWTRDTARFVWPARSRWVVLQVWANHPDIVRMPVQVTVSDRCGTFFDQPFRSGDPVRIGFALRDNEATMDVATHVSRTWRPSAFGERDPRTLGLGVKVNFVSENEARSVERWVQLAPCR